MNYSTKEHNQWEGFILLKSRNNHILSGKKIEMFRRYLNEMIELFDRFNSVKCKLIGHICATKLPAQQYNSMLCDTTSGSHKFWNSLSQLIRPFSEANAIFH